MRKPIYAKVGLYQIFLEFFAATWYFFLINFSVACSSLTGLLSCKDKIAWIYFFDNRVWYYYRFLLYWNHLLQLDVAWTFCKITKKNPKFKYVYLCFVIFTRYRYISFGFPFFLTCSSVATYLRERCRLQCLVSFLTVSQEANGRTKLVRMGKSIIAILNFPALFKQTYVAYSFRTEFHFLILCGFEFS